jgi:hypothetical protein
MNAYADLRAVLETFDPRARGDLRRVLIPDQPDRDAISCRLMRYRDQNGDDWAEIIDMLTMDPEDSVESFGCWRRSKQPRGHGDSAKLLREQWRDGAPSTVLVSAP